METAADAPLRIGFVPEHFSTPLHFAVARFSLKATLIPFPSGTGHMITAIRANEIDVGIGLTEGWIAGLARARAEGREGGYSLVGTYVDTPLSMPFPFIMVMDTWETAGCGAYARENEADEGLAGWAISTGANREDITSVEQLRGKKVGISRLGSGSDIMSFVLANDHSWLSSNTSDPPFTPVALQTFAALRAGVNSGTADFFMWEHFTSKRYYADPALPDENMKNDRIKKIGELPTPWPSWLIVSNDTTVPEPTRNTRLRSFMSKLDEGITYFNGHHEEAVTYISTELDYTAEDAREWLKGVRFTQGVRGVAATVIDLTWNLLLKAGVVGREQGPEWRKTLSWLRRDGEE